MINFLLKQLAYAYHWLCFILHLMKSLNTLMLPILQILFVQYYYIPFRQKWLQIFFHDCIGSQLHK